MASRQIALDNLRALAMLAGVVFHAALAHSPMVQPFFPTADASQAPGLDLLLWPLHLVRMPLFFMLAGIFARRSLARHGMGGLMADRARRLLPPLLVGVPLMHGAMGVLLTQAVDHVQHPSPLLRWIRTVQPSGPVEPPLGLGHLWFLYDLMLFIVLLWIARLLLPEAIQALLKRVPMRAWAVVLPVAVGAALSQVSAPHPAPEGLLPQPWALVAYGAYFGAGFLLASRIETLSALRVHGVLLGAGIGACVVFLRLVPAPIAQAGWLVGVVSGAASAWTTLGLLGAAQRWLRWDHPALRRLAEASFWIYLVHLPLLLALQFAVMDWPAPWSVKLPLACAAVLAVGLVTYRWPGRFLVGRRPSGAAARPRG